MHLKAKIRKLSKKYLPHSLRHYRNVFFRKIGEDELHDFFKRLGVREGMTIYVQSSFSSLGYYPKGAVGLIELLLELVGPKGTIVMPSFPFSGSMADYVATNPIFDVRDTPSTVGYMSEVFRTFPGVKRSIHPTHPVAALGRRAAEITAGHEKTVTPQGEDSPFAELARANAYILRIGTAYYPLFHYLQEKLDYPNQFLPDSVCLECLDYNGNVLPVTTRVHYPSLAPYIFCLERKEGEAPALVNFSDFPILYRGNREEKLRSDPERRAGYIKLIEYRRAFADRHELGSGQVNGCRCELFSAADSLDFAVKEAGTLLNIYRDFYTLTNLERIISEKRFYW